MNTYVEFGVIEVVDGKGSYPALLGIGSTNDILAVINFKKCVMTFENPDIRVIASMEPTKLQRDVEPVKEEDVRGWDHAYNISEDYIHLNANGELDWWSSRSASFESDDALENW